MGKKTTRAEALLLLTAAIWGFAFVAQRVGMAHVGPFAFNGIRFALGLLALFPLLFSRGRGEGVSRRLLVKGIQAGIILFLGASLQQIGIVDTTAGKAGFITGLYVILVPLLGLFDRQLPGGGTWLGALLALLGLYLLTGLEGRGIGGGDLLVLSSAFFFALHVLIIGRLTSGTGLPVIPLAAVQFGTCSLLSLVTSVFLEETTGAGLKGAAIPIVYGGILSVGVGYTLQVAGQREAAPAHAAILLSMETLFAVLGGRLLLGERLPPAGIVGCALMLAGILSSQVSVARAGGRGTREREEKGER